MTGLSVDVDETLEQEAGEVIKQVEKSFTESFYQVAFILNGLSISSNVYFCYFRSKQL